MLATLLLVIHVLVGILVCIVILMQSAKGEGLSGAFGMGQGTTAFFGADTSNILVKITTVLAVIFMLTCMGLAYIQAQRSRSVIGGTASERPPAEEGAMSATPGEEEPEEPGGEAPEEPSTEEPSETGTTPETETGPTTTEGEGAEPAGEASSPTGEGGATTPEGDTGESADEPAPPPEETRPEEPSPTPS